MPVSEHLKVADVKRLLAQHLDAQAAAAAHALVAAAEAAAAADGAAAFNNDPTPAVDATAAAAPRLQDPRCLRLRDKKVAAVGSILRDGASLRRALVRLSDGRQVAVQLLDAPETVWLMGSSGLVGLAFTAHPPVLLLLTAADPCQCRQGTPCLLMTLLPSVHVFCWRPLTLRVELCLLFRRVFIYFFCAVCAGER